MPDTSNILSFFYKFSAIVIDLVVYMKIFIFIKPKIFLSICKFIRKCFDDFYTEMAYLYSQATGLDLTASELKVAGERINNVKKAFNIREGWKCHDDWLPPRLFSEPITEGEGKGTVITEEELSLMIGDYYQARGWTAEGLITEDKLRALQLENSIAPVKGLKYGKKIYNL